MLFAKIRGWHKKLSGFEPMAELSYWLGRDLHLAGEGGIIMNASKRTIRHGTTFAEPVKAGTFPPKAVEVVAGEPDEEKGPDGCA